MTRVLMLLSNGFTHDPRVAAEAASLTRAGFEVTVLGWDRAGDLPPEEVRGGVRIVRVRNDLWMRLLRYDFLRLRPFWRLATRRALALHETTKFDVVHCHDLDTLPVGVHVKARTSSPLVYDAHEFFPFMIGELSRAKPWEGRFAAIERKLVRRVDHLLVTGPPHRDYFLGMTKSPISIVMNSRPLHHAVYASPANARMKVVYFGSLYRGRLLEGLAELAVEDGSIDVDIAGSGSLAPRIRALAGGSSGNLRYLGVLPMSDVIPRTHEADVVYSILDPSLRLFRVALPNKFFEALVAGRPILVTKNTWLGEEVEAADCGVAIEYTKAALRDAIRGLQADPGGRERMGRNALRLAQERYNWANDEASLLAAYAALGFPS